MRTTSQIVLNTNHFGLSYVVQTENKHGNDSKHLKVVGLKNNTDYVVNWYSFVNGDYLSSDCQNTTSSGKFELKHPVLHPYSSPILWFVLEQADCQGSGMVTQNDETEAQNSDSEDFSDRTGDTDSSSDLSNLVNSENSRSKSLKVYPNPFDNELIIETDFDDDVQLFSATGQIIHSFRVAKGKNMINLDTLLKGVYLLKFTTADEILKLVK